MALLNDFKIGADPEFAIVNGTHAVRFTGHVDRLAPWGVDHGGFVVEPHPKPDVSVREVVKNIKIAMNDFATVAPTGKWVAGPHFAADERGIPMGGHIHIDKPNCNDTQLRALDLFATHMERLDLYPQEGLTRRVREGYGGKSDVRIEHGHFEYRSMPSWLFSQRVTKISLVGTKLIIIDPTAPAEELGAATTASKSKLKKLFQRFHGLDDDADWLLSSGILDMRLKVDPSRDLKEVWRVRPEKEDPHWKLATQLAAHPNAGAPLWTAPTTTIRIQRELARYRFRIYLLQDVDSARIAIRSFLDRMVIPAEMVRHRMYLSEGVQFEYLGVEGENI